MKKGFTLLELLATLVIIAVVFTIAIPITINIIDYVRRESFKISVSNIGRAGEYTYSRSEIDNPLTKEVIFMYEDGTETSNIVGVTLDYDGEKPMHGNVVINKEGYVAISVHNGTYCATKEFTDKEVKIEEISVEDCIREMHLPQIFIVGDYEVDVEINTPYVDEFVTAVTSMGEEITEIEKAIIKDSTVVDSIDTTELGTYSIAYQVEEDDKTVTIFRTVNIVDTIAPVINHPGDTNILSSEVMTFNVLAGVTVADNSLESLSATVSGGFSKIPDSYIITYRAEDSSGNITTETRVINVNDASAPIITILGDNPMNININDSYTELGATATDEVDGDVTGLIEKSGSIDTTIKGTQYITYSVTDLSGNTSSLSRTVNIIDNIEPTIDFGIKLSDTFAKSHVVGVTATDDHSSIDTLKYAWTTSTTEPGTFNNNFANGATITTPSGVSGSYYLWVEAVDSEGNRAVSRTDSYDLDNTPPVITHPGNSTITLTQVDTYDLLNGVAVTDNSGEEPVISVVGSIARIPGTYTINYASTDSSGNEGFESRDIVVVDNIKPTINFSSTSNSTYSKSHTTVVSFSDAHSSVSSSRYTWTTSASEPGSFSNSFSSGSNLSTPSGVSGNYYLWIEVIDSAGNRETSRAGIFRLDNTRPIIVQPGDTSLVISQVNSYNLLSGVSVSDNSGETLSISVSGSIARIPGVYTINYSSTDSSGNLRTVSRNITINDVESPVITLNGSGTINMLAGGSYSELGATASDDVDGNITSSINISGSVNTSVVGSYTLTYSVTDSSGNVGNATRTVNVTDNTAPSVSFSTNGNSTYAKSRTTNVTVTDADSGVASRHYLWTTSTTTPSAASITSSFTNGSSISTPSGVTGSYYLWVKSMDNAGNQDISRSNVFRLDNTRPVITRTGGNVSITRGSTYTDSGATASDNVDGNITSRITSSGSVNTSALGTYTITYNVSDLSGNTATSVTRTVTVYDNTAPVVSFSLNGSTTYARSRTTSVTVTDASSSVTSRHYLWTTSTTTPSAASITSSFTNGATIATPSGVTGARYLWIKAIDSAGNVGIVRSNVFNLDNTRPVITRTGGNTSVSLGGSYSDAGATASDNINGNITSRITTSGSVNTNIAGTYTITYNVTDLSGNAATSVARTVTVNPRTEYRYRDSYQSCSTCWNTCNESQAASSSTSYSCPSGWSLSGTTCSRTTTSSASSSTTYSCSTGSLVGPDCRVNGSTTTTYSCPTGSVVGPDCRISAGSSQSCSGGRTLIGGVCRYVTYQDPCPSYYFDDGGGRCASNSSTSPTTSYSCPSGWWRSGTSCYRPAIQTPNTTCPSGWWWNGEGCYRSASQSTSYSCPSGCSRSGTTCYCTSTQSASSSTTYSCPSGWSRSGSTCSRSYSCNSYDCNCSTQWYGWSSWSTTYRSSSSTRQVETRQITSI